MKCLFTIFTVLLLLALAIPVARSQEVPEICPTEEWFNTFVLIQGGVDANIPTPEDSTDILADKTINLFAYSYVLEVLSSVVPDCAKPLISKYAVLVGVYADFGMLVVLQSGDLGLSEESFTYLLEQYSALMVTGEASVGKAYRDLNLEETLQ